MFTFSNLTCWAVLDRFKNCLLHLQLQIEYAALDALVGVDIFTHLVLAKMQGSKPSVTEDMIGQCYSDEFWETARSLCQGIVDVQYKQKGSKDIPKPASSDSASNIPAGVARLAQAWKKEQFLKVGEFFNASYVYTVHYYCKVLFIFVAFYLGNIRDDNRFTSIKHNEYDCHMQFFNT